MVSDSNRGRDLPRAPKFQRIKGIPKQDTPGYSATVARRRETVWKALDRATRAHGFNTLLEQMASTTLLVGLSEKSKEKERKLIVEALALGLTVHPGMLTRYGLEEQPNPKVPPSDPDEAPF
jgi:hypothetical protein